MQQWICSMGAGQLTKTTAIKKHYRGLGRAVGRSQIQADLQGFDIFIIGDVPRMAPARFWLSRTAIRWHLFLFIVRFHICLVS